LNGSRYRSATKAEDCSLGTKCRLAEAICAFNYSSETAGNLIISLSQPIQRVLKASIKLICAPTSNQLARFFNNVDGFGMKIDSKVFPDAAMNEASERAAMYL
jgi:hypothetical protein